jgi:NADPH-dependent ferric siderophore reductase
VLAVPAETVPRVRRAPPPFRQGVVAAIEPRTPHLVRVTLRGAELAEFESPAPAGGVRLLLPDAPGAELVIPVWNGNAFFHVDGRRPVIRTLTPLRHDGAAGELDLDVVLHGEGPLSTWAATASPGDPAAVSGPSRGYTIDPTAPRFVLAGDESAIPAIGQLVAAIPDAVPTTVIIEVAHPDARVALPERAEIEQRWVGRAADAVPGDALVAAVMETELELEARVWAAGEAAAMQRIRRHLFETLGISRRHATVRGYWKHGRSSTDDDEL